jgi:hypothetical protein
MPSVVSAQENLMSNSGFEEFTFCPYTAGQIVVASPWVRVRGSVDYFNECGTNGYQIPVNIVGDQDAFEGQGYCGIVPWAREFDNAREFVGCPLSTNLKPEAKYHVRMYLSMADTVQYAVRNMGVLFTESQPTNDLNQLMNAAPQVVYEDSAFLDDREGWMLFEGSFIAQGGEQFMTIGNFDTDEETDTLFVVEQASKSAYYYIDDVSVVEDTSGHVGINEELRIKNDELVHYPNPATDVLTIEAIGRDMAFELLDVQGKAIQHQHLQALRQNIDVSHLPAGVYVAVLRQDGVAVARRKVVIQR